MARLAALRVVIAVLALAATGHAFAASFDCRKAKSVTEKTICAKPALNTLDQSIGNTYRTLLKLVGQTGARDQFRADQQSWLNVRDTCGSDADCLGRTYRARIYELEGYIHAVKAAK